ncbi:hypothetical protein DAPPUDRAFT_330942 [Daphnia pulex]|uniref:Uncharacterized protein n=1 Tax=Daphnia pulex TaxID=6669 RepID=E9HL24_DAPPU|nr:hypothetical protein DAPPUDRAFT_330942 [Daphnia pulex]|eukprot:EFX67529.1 hypothetical protein DAPPUDRAFT_330942 [Daphnia pulex]
MESYEEAKKQPQNNFDDDVIFVHEVKSYCAHKKLPSSYSVSIHSSKTALGPADCQPYSKIVVNVNAEESHDTTAVETLPAATEEMILLSDFVSVDTLDVHSYFVVVSWRSRKIISFEEETKVELVEKRRLSLEEMERYSERDRLRAEQGRLLEQDANEELQRRKEEDRFDHKDLDLLSIRAFLKQKAIKKISLNSHVTTDVIPHSTIGGSRLASASLGVVIQPSLANRENMSFGALPKRGLAIQSDRAVPSQDQNLVCPLEQINAFWIKLLEKYN